MLGTGIPKVNFTGDTFADVLRLNLSIPVTPAARSNRFGVLGGDNAGFPNGRRLGDDVVDIEEQAVAGFLKGKKVPLGDGVDANDMAEHRPLPVRARPARRASPTRRRRSSETGRGGPALRRALVPTSRRHGHAPTRLRPTLAPCRRRRSRPSSAASFRRLDLPRAARARRSQSAEDFKAGFSLDAGTASLVARASSRALRAQPEGPALLYALLGLAYEQRARETGDPSYYAESASGALRRALALDPKDALAVSGLGSLAALAPPLPRRARARPAARTLAPSTARHYGVIGDALVELGRYREAFRAFDAMNAPSPEPLLVRARLLRARAARRHAQAPIAAMKLAVDAADRPARADSPGRTSSSASST